MIRRWLRLVFILIPVPLLFFGGCSDEYDYPDEPVLWYKDFVFVKNGTDQITKGILQLEFTDGDGDIGLGQEDTLPPYDLDGDYYYNFIIDLYARNDTTYDKVVFPDTNYTFNSRIPRIILNGNSKAIKGVIEYTFDLELMKPFLPNDTIMIKAFIIDRALHRSNQVVTPDIVLP
jgi:hypothetical protein